MSSDAGIRQPSPPSSTDRRRFLKLAGATGTAAALGGGLAACARRTASPLASRPIRLGYVSPQSGVLAPFGEADNFVLDRIRRRLEDGLEIGGSSYPVEVLVQDSQSDPERAASVTEVLIDQGIDLMLAASTPETTNPVSAVCEKAKHPCVTSMAPWQSWYLGRPDARLARKDGYTWTYHFCWGLEDLIAVYLEMWDAIPTNHLVGALWPDDADGLAFQANFPAALERRGYRLITPPNQGIVKEGRYESSVSDFRDALRHFMDEGVEIVTGVPTPPDFATIWKQANDLGFRPKAVTAAKALLFPSFLEALAPDATGVTTELWWSPEHPFKSSLTSQSARELADEYIVATDKQWTQPIGHIHALFEVAADIMRRAADLDDPDAVREAIADTQMDTVAGPVGWRPDSATVPDGAPNVSKTPLVGGQWVGGGQFPFDVAVVTENEAAIRPSAGIKTLA